jgi:endo-1,4-beta-xylanase
MLATLLWLSTAAIAQTSLKDAYKPYFHVGAALNRAEIQGTDGKSDEIAIANFDSISPENALKWAVLHPKEGSYDFTLADQYVAFGEKHHMLIIGHVLVWHEQTPRWVFEDSAGKPATREVLLQRMRDHIHTVVGRYKGRIHGWDVVNEALNEDGSMRQSEWQKIIGDDYIEKAFAYAHEADPQAELYYNDFEIENEAKRKAALALIARLRKEGIPIAAVGIQSHDSLTWPTVQQLDAAIAEFARLGVKVNITELDVDVLPRPGQDNGNAEINRTAKEIPELDPYKSGLPQQVQQKLAARYADLFRVFVQHRDDIGRVTFWGVTDATSWLNNWPVRGRTNYPLLFDREGKPKPAYPAVIRVATQK